MLPEVTSHLPSSTVHSRLLLVTGIIPVPSLDGDLWITTHKYSFPAQTFPVRASAFKALLHLSPGENSLTLDFRPSSLPGASYKSVFDVTYIPLLQNPPLHLVIIVGKDSPFRYDDVPNCGEPPNLETAIKKFRMAAYLWQAYTGSEMNAMGFGHRTFRLDEAWLPDTLSKVDTPRRSTAKITVLRSSYSVAHIRDPDRAQQNRGGKASKGLFDIAIEALKAHEEFPGAMKHVAALFLDSTWDRARSLISGHAALGSQDAGGFSLGIFGSHSLFAWPSCVEAVVPAFNDTRMVDQKFCGVDCEGKTYHMAANVGIGAFMHEVGHGFGCPHQSSGVMLRDYTSIARSFSVLVPPSVPNKECHWHVLDALRFVRHPCFALPSDPFSSQGGISAALVPSGLLITCTNSPLLFLEFRTKGSEHPTNTIQPRDQHSIVIPHSQLAIDSKINIFAASSHISDHTIESTAQLLHSHTRVDPMLGTVFRTPAVGTGKGTFQRTMLPAGRIHCIRIFSGAALDGLEFVSSTGESALFGKRGGSANDFVLGQGEEVRGFVVRSGAWVDALGVVTSHRRGEMFGGKGGGTREAVVPNGARIVGIAGDVAQWTLGISVEYVFDREGAPPLPPRPM